MPPTVICYCYMTHILGSPCAMLTVYHMYTWLHIPRSRAVWVSLWWEYITFIHGYIFQNPGQCEYHYGESILHVCMVTYSRIQGSVNITTVRVYYIYPWLHIAGSRAVWISLWWLQAYYNTCIHGYSFQDPGQCITMVTVYHRY